ncbi:MAG: MATE family efflux transporter [Spirochaetes bacterium]|nr:MATE family efflux transporter [Spirochaetota bacterium]
MKKVNIRSGALIPTLINLSLPVLAGQFCALLYNIVDTFFISRIDPSDPWLVGATGLVWPLYFIFMAISFGITGGVSSLVARAIGAGKEHELDCTAESGLFLALITSFISLLIMYLFASPILSLFGGEEMLHQYGLCYLLWVLPAIPFMLLSSVFIGILQGEGRTKHMMTSMMIGTVANIILDPLLMFTAGMGIAGAGLATALGNAAAFLYLYVVFRRTESKVKIHWSVKNISFATTNEIIRVGLPQSVTNILASISFIFYNRIMVGIDPKIITAFTLYSRLEQLALIPIWSLLSALSTVAGQAAGALDFKRMRKSASAATKLGLGVSGVLFLLYFILSPWLFRIFQDDAGVLSLASVIVMWMPLTSLFSIPVFMITTVMSVAGFANRSLFYTAIRIYVINIPACAFGAYVVGKNIQWVMASIFISAVIALVFFIIVERRFFSGLESGRLKVREVSKK